ncbi:hypothetical protein [Streptomyces sp. NPDC052610]|uniref:hypothetical protein n=1 Tax=Streptomyces sp. NPDC052610 TaxID=3154952 RepID=UPI003416BB04
MLAEGLTALAAAGGTAVVQAAGTDAWATLRDRVAGWFGRGDAARERDELERLEATAGELTAAEGGADAERLRAHQEQAWQARFAMMLESLREQERARAAAELRDLVGPAAAEESGGTVTGTFHGPTVVQTGHHNRQDVRFGTGS